MKNKISRWRMDGELKSKVEHEARRRGVSVSRIVESAVREWLRKNAALNSEGKTQKELYAAAERCFGTLPGHASATADIVRGTVRRRVRERIRRSQKEADSSLRSE